MNSPIPLSRYIGKCIYCGSTDNLTREHVVPRGLGGPWLLLKASCKKCARITSDFEGGVLGGILYSGAYEVGLTDL